MPHRRRPRHAARCPVHVTMRAAAHLGSLRRPSTFLALRAALAAMAAPAAREARPDFRVVHYSVQRDHVHLVVEAHDARALSSGARAVAIRLALAANRVAQRRGRVWQDRYHARELDSPRAVRNAIVYVLFNAKKHGHRATVVDPCSSSAWFGGFAPGPALAHWLPERDGPPPVQDPATWLGALGWRRHGLIDLDEQPREPG